MTISLHQAATQDIEFLWYLRNQSDVHCYFRTPKPASWEDHIQWIMPRILGLVPSTLYVIEADKISAGQVRIDHQGKDSAEVSISLLQEFRGKGIAKEALRQAVDMVQREGKIKHLLAEIHRENTASQHLFEHLGFIFEREEGDWRYYRLEL